VETAKEIFKKMMAIIRYWCKSQER
jgi:hypothetical protein